jgi:hypothetical protein
MPMKSGPRISAQMNNLRLRIKALLNRRELEGDLEDELQFHFAMRQEKDRAEGLAASDARDSAHRKFGNSNLPKERCREMWTFGSLETIGQDVRYGLRILRANPAFTTVAILSLALGIGANTAIFSLIDAILLRDLPVRDPGQLVEVMPANHSGDNAGVSSRNSGGDNSLFFHVRVVGRRARESGDQSCEGAC